MCYFRGGVPLSPQSKQGSDCGLDPSHLTRKALQWLCRNRTTSSVALKPESWRHHSSIAKSFSGTNPNSKLTKFLAVSQYPLSVVSINQFSKASSILGTIENMKCLNRAS